MATTKFATVCLAIASMLSPASTLPVHNQEEKRQTIGAPCTDVHIFLAKGWNEPYPGRQGKLAGAICWGLDSCDYEDIQYYNPPEADYCASITEGNINGVAQMTAYAERCPDSRLVLTGYSQGANVAGDVLGGGGGRFGNETVYCTVEDTPGLNRTTSPGNKIGAALLFGDNRHVADQSYNVLSGSAISANNPRFPASLANMNQFSDILRSYCVESDPVCAAAGPGPFVVDNHLNYFDIYSDDAAAWVKTTLAL